jgi:hypothetical protein
MPEPATTLRQRQVMKHALGVRRNVRGERNRFFAPIGGDNDKEVQELIAMGLMERGETINRGMAYLAYVTDAGIAELDLDEPLPEPEDEEDEEDEE